MEITSLVIIYYLLSHTRVTESTEHKASQTCTGEGIEPQIERIENVRELNTKQACILAFIVYYNVHIVIIIATDVSGVTILIDMDLLTQ